MGPAGVVSDHPTEISSATGRNIRTKLKSMGNQVGVQFVEHDTRLYADPSLLCIQFEDLAHVAREIKVEARPHGLTRQTGSSTARQDGESGLGRRADTVHHIFGVMWDDNASRVDLIDTGIVGVEDSGQVIETYVTPNSVSKFLGDGR